MSPEVSPALVLDDNRDACDFPALATGESGLRAFLAGIRMVSSEFLDGEPDGFVCELSGFFDPLALAYDVPLVVRAMERGASVCDCVATACVGTAAIVYDDVGAEGKDWP